MAEISASAAPAIRVNLNNNEVDGTKMTGGYESWQLLPYGEQVSPVGAKSGPYTVGGATSLVMGTGDSNYDVFYPQAGVDFSKDELITITGPNNQGHGRSVIMMLGKTSTKKVSFVYTGGQN